LTISTVTIFPWRVYLGLGLLAVALAGAMGYVVVVGARVDERYVPLVRASEEIQLDATLAHLWFEEILSGDRHESMDEVWDRLEAARRKVRAMIEGEKDIYALDDLQLSAKARLADAKLAEFASITDARWQARRTSASGTQIDQAYDAVFRQVVALADEVEVELHGVIRRETRAARRAQGWAIAATLGVLGLTGLLFARYTGQRRRVEESLRLKVGAEEEARRHLEELAHVVRLSHMSELVAGIAHEVNQPLSAVATSAAACRRLVDAGRAGSPEHLDALKLIESETSRASDVVSRLRAFIAKRESTYETVDVNRLVRRVVGLGRLDPQFREAVIRLNLAADLPPVEVDSVQIQQVLLNLLRNGYEATDGLDGDRRAIEIGTRLGANGDVEVSVVDRGRGVPDDLVGKTFAPFFTTKSSGMGMGLSISHSIVTAHGGRIWFDSNRPGPGTTFRFTLPVAVEAGS